jgi:hypothetical protein
LLNNDGEHVAVDGPIGPKTATALKHYRQKQGSTATGQPDRVTIGNLPPTMM